jgi:MinD-like ATPase involved in chromosome partitioning or flagellar assembly
MKPPEGVWRPIGAEYVNAILSQVRQFCSYVVLDLGSRVDESCAAALKACDRVTVVLDTEPAAIDQCAALLRQLEMVLSPKTPEIRLVAVDRLHQDQRMVAKHMSRRLKLTPVLTVTPAGDDLTAAYLEGTPLVTTPHPDDAFSRSMQALADVLVASDSRQDGVGHIHEVAAQKCVPAAGAPAADTGKARLSGGAFRHRSTPATRSLPHSTTPSRSPSEQS